MTWLIPRSAKRSWLMGLEPRSIVVAVVTALHNVATRLLRWVTPSQQPRTWSNDQLRAVAGRVSGSVMHVSAWKDDDKQGHKYREYFPRASAYATSNFGGSRGEVLDGEFDIDLSQPLPDNLRHRFDFVFNHTTLEHVFDIDRALANLFELSRSEVFVVVPFMQVEHWEAPSFGDYWRVGRHGLIEASVRNGFEVLSVTSNHNPVWPIYYCLHARRIDPVDGERVSERLWDLSGDSEGFGFRPVGSRHPLMQ